MCLAVFVLCLISRMCLCLAATLRCRPSELPVNGHALNNHTFMTSVAQDPIECQVLCENVLTCQSYNYFIPGKICELNNRTKEARPDNFVPDEDRFYVKNWPNRGRGNAGFHHREPTQMERLLMFQNYKGVYGKTETFLLR